MSRTLTVAFAALLLGFSACTQVSPARESTAVGALGPPAAAICALGSGCLPVPAAASAVAAPIAALTSTPLACAPGPCDATVDLQPAADTVAPGGAISVTVEATPRVSVHLGTYIIDVAYDPAVIRPINCDQNLSECNLNFAANVVRIVGESPDARFAFPTKQPTQASNSPAQAPSPPSYGSPLAELTFQAIGTAGTSSPLTLSVVSVVDPRGQPSTTTSRSGVIRVDIASATSSRLAASELTFIDPLHGWALGVASPCSQDAACTGQAVLWSTVDGGQTWQQLPPPHLVSGALLNEEQHILFLNQRDGFLYGPDLYTTHDGGQSWQDNASHGWLQLAGVGGRVLALKTDCDLTNASFCAQTAMAVVSDDAGRSWSPLPDPPPIAAVALLATPGTADVWWLGRGDAVTLFHSSDAGQHWQFAGLTPACGAPLAAYADGRIWLVCKGQPTGGWEFFRSVDVSDDGGRSWQQVVTPAQGGPGYARSLAAVSRTRAYIVGDRVGLLETDNRGGAWATQLPDKGGNGFAAVAFIDGAHGWALHPPDEGDPAGTVGIVWRTTDGGTTWARTGLP